MEGSFHPRVRAKPLREMTIWGPIFHQIESDQDFGNVRLQNLTKYPGSQVLVRAWLHEMPYQPEKCLLDNIFRVILA